MGELSYTVGGDSNLVSFKSAARVPITSLKAHFKPKQDLHGYSKPWPAGSGKNLFNPLDAVEDNYATSANDYTINNDIIRYDVPLNYDSLAWAGSKYISVIPEQTYTVTLFYINEYAQRDKDYENNVVRIYAYDDDQGTNISQIAVANVSDIIDNKVSVIFTIPSNKTYIKIVKILHYPITTGDYYEWKCQLEKGSTATSYVPYENICPIEGWNQCEVYLSSQYLPEEYQEVEYLEGKNALIDLNYIVKTDPSVIITMNIKNDLDRDIMGFYNNTVPSFIINPAPGSKRWYNRYYTTSGLDFTSMPPILGEKATWEFGNINKKNDNIIHIRYTETSGIDWSTNTQTFYLFGARNVHADVIIYDFKLYDGGTLVRNLIPCYRKSDNEPGMYDTITGTFFVNQYNGEFICGPAVGCTIPITFPVLGKNKLDKNYLSNADNYSEEGPYGYWYTPPIFLIPNTTYIMSYTQKIEDNQTALWALKIYKGEDYSIGGSSQAIRYPYNGSNGLRTYNSFTTGSAGAIRFAINRQQHSSRQDALDFVFSKADWQIELGSTATTYESYDPNNTVYGGYVDPAAGELVSEWNTIVVDGSNDENWQLAESGLIFALVINGMLNSRTVPICDRYYATNPLNTSFNLRLPKDQLGVDTIAEFRAILSENPLTVIYPVADPIHYPLTKQQIKSLLGTNAVWSNTNDITELSYAIYDTAPIRAAKERMIAFAAKKEEEIRVPSAYRKLQYISAIDSNPYITTSITYPNELEAEIHFYNTKTEAFVFGARNDISKKPYCNLNISSEADKIRFDYGDYKYHVSTTGKTGEKIFKFHNRVGTMIHVDTSTTKTYSYDTAVFTSYTSNPLLLFAVNTNGSPSLGDSQGELRMYSAKFWVGGKLVGNFLPCKRKSDDVVGMYDTITKQFYTSTNTDTFTAGPVA